MLSMSGGPPKPNCGCLSIRTNALSRASLSWAVRKHRVFLQGEAEDLGTLNLTLPTGASLERRGSS
jgi:hypothetical protein